MVLPERIALTEELGLDIVADESHVHALPVSDSEKKRPFSAW